MFYCFTITVRYSLIFNANVRLLTYY